MRAPNPVQRMAASAEHCAEIMERVTRPGTTDEQLHEINNRLHRLKRDYSTYRSRDLQRPPRGK